MPSPQATPDTGIFPVSLFLFAVPDRAGLTTPLSRLTVAFSNQTAKSRSPHAIGPVRRGAAPSSSSSSVSSKAKAGIEGLCQVKHKAVVAFFPTRGCPVLFEPSTGNAGPRPRASIHPPVSVLARQDPLLKQM